MKTMMSFRLLLAALVFTALAVTVHAQTPVYKDVVVDNPNAEADMKVMADFSNALAAGDGDKMKSHLSDKAVMTEGG